MLHSSAHRSFIQLWFARVGDSTIPIEHATQQLLSPSEQTRLQATSNNNKRREFLLSRALMRHALSKQLKLEQQFWHFIEQPDLAPIVSNLPEDLYFSLTHSKGTICFALASYPVGVDLEIIRENRDFKGLMKTIMNNEEIDFLEQQPQKLTENFYRIWCAKEASYKALSTQQQSRLTLMDVPVISLLLNLDAKGPCLMAEDNGQFMLAAKLQSTPQLISCQHFPEKDHEIKALAGEFNKKFTV